MLILTFFGQKHSSQEYSKCPIFDDAYFVHVVVLILFLSSRDIQLASTITVPEGMLVIGGWNQESGSLRENPNSGGFYKPGFKLRAVFFWLLLLYRFAPLFSNPSKSKFICWAKTFGRWSETWTSQFLILPSSALESGLYLLRATAETTTSRGSNGADRKSRTCRRLENTRTLSCARLFFKVQKISALSKIYKSNKNDRNKIVIFN